MAELTTLQEHLRVLMNHLSAAEIRKLSAKVGRDLRKRQNKRIAAQQNPDGSAYVPRKQQRIKKRDKRGRIKKKMFNTIKNAKFMKVQPTRQGVDVGFFTSRIARIARVHQEGFKDRPRPTARTVQYPKRELLGLSPDDEQFVFDSVSDHISNL
jgi:phage virion morphogenesis protein